MNIIPFLVALKRPALECDATCEGLDPSEDLTRKKISSKKRSFGMP